MEGAGQAKDQCAQLDLRRGEEAVGVLWRDEREHVLDESTRGNDEDDQATMTPGGNVQEREDGCV